MEKINGNGNGKISVKTLYWVIGTVVLIVGLFLTIGTRIDQAVACHPSIVELKTNQRIVIENQKEMAIQLEKIKDQITNLQSELTRQGVVNDKRELRDSNKP